jgi:hypothetical protein
MAVMVNHNYPGDLDLQVLAPNGDPIEGVVVTVFPHTEYHAGIVDTWIGQTTTDGNGNWVAPIYLDEDLTYVVHFEKPTMYGPVVLEITT